MKISFIGTGHVGLVSGVMMSYIGHEVTCIDIDEFKINQLRQGTTTIFESGLNQYMDLCYRNNQLKFIHGYDRSIQDAECIFITVGTPTKKNGDQDLSEVFACCTKVAPYISNKCAIVIKSTVLPGTCLKISQFIKNKGLINSVISNPEFLREGQAIQDFLNPDRIVIGAQNAEDFRLMRQIYEPIISQGITCIETNLNTSELIKYVSNTFLANKIALMNEMANLCEIIDADITKLSYAVGLDKRIGHEFLNVGPGFGGSCFPKDLLALQQLSRHLDSRCLILDSVIKSNKYRSQYIFNKIMDAIGLDISKKNIAILGLTYKAGTDDLRNSPTIALIHKLRAQNANIVAYDPQGIRNIENYLEDLYCVNNLYQAIEYSDAIIIMTEWLEFKNIDLIKAKKIVKQPVIIDLRNVIDNTYATYCGFKYYSIGQKDE